MPERDRTRGLEQIDEILEISLETTIRQMAERGQVNALEVGFGWGRALCDLAWRLRDAAVSFHGVDIGLKSPITCREDLRTTCREFEIVPESHILGFRPPAIDLYDATNLRLDDESMDFVWSAVTIRFMHDKARFIEEVTRVLRPGGRAVLHLGESKWDYPYSIATDDRVLTPYLNRMVLRFGDRLVPLPAYMRLFEAPSFRFRFTPETRCLLHIDKLSSGQISLQLDYDDALSMKGRDLPLVTRKGKLRGGFRTVYNVRPTHYEELFRREILSHEALRTDIGPLPRLAALPGDGSSPGGQTAVSGAAFAASAPFSTTAKGSASCR